MSDNLTFDLSVCLPIWYGAKINEVENILDSFYSALEVMKKEYSTSKIKFLIGIDNVPEGYVGSCEKPNRSKDILKRIDIFKNAVVNLSKNIEVEFFITEHNEKVSVMRNIMISKSQDSNYLVFLDHDDKIKIDGFNVLLSNINIYKNTDINFIYFKILHRAKIANIGFASWSVLYRSRDLFEKQISFIPGIPLEDRLFRRELELFSIKEEQLDSLEEFYSHSREQGSGWLNKDVFDIVEQEFFKRSYFKSIKPKIYSNIKIGLDEIFFVNNNLDIEISKNNKANNNKTFFELNYSDKLLKKEDLNDFKFMNGYGLFKYPQKNQFLLCKIKTNNNKEEIFCKGYLTNGTIKIDTNTFDKFNKLVDGLGMESSKLIYYLKYLPKAESLEDLAQLREKDILKAINTNDINLFKNILNNDKNIDFSFADDIKLSADFVTVLNKYIFCQAYDAIIREDTELLKKLAEKYPVIFDLKDSRGINLANIACRRQTIKSIFNENVKNFFTKDKDKIIMFLFIKTPNSFTFEDKYKISGFKLLLEEYIYNLKTKVNLNIKDDFIKVIFDLVELFDDKEEAYQLVEYFRIICRNLETINKLIHKKKKIAEILKELRILQEDYFFNEFVVENLIEAIEQKNYEQVKHILLSKNLNSYRTMGIEKYDLLELIFSKYTSFKHLILNLNKREKNILFYIENDEIIKQIMKQFFVETIFIHFDDKFKKDIFNPFVITRIREAFVLLFDEKYHFDYEEIDFKDFYNLFIQKSLILKNAKTILESSDKKANLIKNKLYIRKIDEINIKQQNCKIIDNKVGKMILECEKIKDSEQSNYEKILTFLDSLNKLLCLDQKHNK
ncbi:MAG: hypothetical protein PHY80_03720 [Rickettsiales bacterium]|nr:hypothetical protein [Rickettsiales bacterium]